MGRADLKREIEDFLEAYRAAFDRLDGEAIADLYAVPSGLLAGRAYVHWARREEIVANLSALCAIYARDGYAGARREGFEVVPLGADSVLTNVSWRLERSHGGLPHRFRTAYNLVRSTDGWRVLLCTAYEEESPGRDRSRRP